jgi:hypothetical protein
MTEYVNFFDGYIENDELWFSNIRFNALMKMNIKTGDTEMISVFPGRERESENLHCRVIKAGDRLFFIPYISNIVHVWDLKKGAFLPNIEIGPEENAKYVAAAVDDENKLWIVPENLLKPIVIIDTGRCEIADRVNIPDVTTPERPTAGLETDLKNVVFYGNTFFIQSYRENGLWKLGCADRSTKFYEFAGVYRPVSLNTFDGENFYFFNYPDNRLMMWNMRDNSVRIISRGYPFVDGRNPFGGILKTNDGFLFVPCHCDSFCAFDPQTYAITELPLPENFKRCSPFALTVYHKVYQDKLYLFPRSGNELLVMDTGKTVISEISYKYPESFVSYAEDVLQRIFDKYYEGSSVYESFLYDETLGRFLDKVVTGDESSSSKQQPSNAGRQIHEFVKKRYIAAIQNRNSCDIS